MAVCDHCRYRFSTVTTTSDYRRKEGEGEQRRDSVS